MLYEVAIIKKPTPKEIQEGLGEKLILAPKAIVANNEKTAIAAATQGLGDDLANTEILVRPFV